MSFISVSWMFNKNCAKVIDPNTMEVLREEVAKTMSTIDKIFLPTNFDVMTHLVIHIVEELDLCGLVATRWMYPIEHYMKVLKGYVPNLAQLKGNMANVYSIEKAIGFYT